METEWPEVRFADLLSEPVRNGIYKKKEFHGRGARIVNMGELFGYPRLFDVEMKRVELTDNERTKVLLKSGDLLFARRSLTAEGAGKCSIVKSVPQETTFESSIIRARPDPQKADSDYLYYFFSSPHGKYLVGTILRQVAVAGITGTDLKELPIPKPDVQKQKAIAHILGTLDDKIELNRQMNASLEAMAQALFKSWFVDFDPVIDNALAAGNPIPEPLQGRADAREALGDQRKPLPAAIQNQFPDHFVFNDELGWVPEGWGPGPLSGIASLTTTSVHPNEAPERIWEHFSIPAFDSSQRPTLEPGMEIKSGKYRVPPTAILASKLNPQFPRIWMPNVGDEDSAICSTEFMPFVPLEQHERPFLYLLLCSRAVQSQIENRVTGTTGSRQRVKPKEIAELPILMVPSVLRGIFSREVENLLKRQSSNQQQELVLAQTRDTLLPKLLSGQLRVPDAERLTARVT